MWVWHGIADPARHPLRGLQGDAGGRPALSQANARAPTVGRPGSSRLVWLLSGAHGLWMFWPMLGRSVFPLGQLLFERTARSRGSASRTLTERGRRADPHPPRRARRAGRRAAAHRARPARRRAGAARGAVACSSAGPRSGSPTSPRSRSWCARRAARPARRSPSCATWPAGSRRRCWPTAAWRPRSRRSAQRSAVAVERRRGRRPAPAAGARDGRLLRRRRGADQRGQARAVGAVTSHVRPATDERLVVDDRRRRAGRRRPGRRRAHRACATGSRRSTARCT